MALGASMDDAINEGHVAEMTWITPNDGAIGHINCVDNF